MSNTFAFTIRGPCFTIIVLLSFPIISAGPCQPTLLCLCSIAVVCHHTIDTVLLWSCRCSILTCCFDSFTVFSSHELLSGLIVQVDIVVQLVFSSRCLMIVLNVLWYIRLFQTQTGKDRIRVDSQECFLRTLLVLGLLIYSEL